MPVHPEITELLIRFYTPELESLAWKLCDLLDQMLPEVERRIVDHTKLTLDDFRLCGRPPVSLDSYLAEKFNIPKVAVSRVFHQNGTVSHRQIALPTKLPDDPCVIDTDICSGETMNAALRLLGSNTYSVPLRVQRNQDLIDVEDLCSALSLASWPGAPGGKCTYLCNPEFFSRRTSLPARLYRPVQTLVARHIGVKAMWDLD